MVINKVVIFALCVDSIIEIFDINTHGTIAVIIIFKNIPNERRPIVSFISVETAFLIIPESINIEYVLIKYEQKPATRNKIQIEISLDFLK